MNTSATQKTQLKGAVFLLLTALIWGFSFVAQSLGMEKIGAFTFNGLRTLLGAAVLAPIVLLRDRRSSRGISPSQQAARRSDNRLALKYGTILGLVFCLASNFQQFAFYDSTSGKIAFITALYIFFVPLFGLLFKKRVPLFTWCCIVLGFVGLYFLCIGSQGFGAINRGDVLALICAAFYAVHILLIEHFVPHADGVKLSCIQFVVSGVISCLLMFVFETPNLTDIIAAGPPLLYSGIMSCGVAYTFQIIGQKYTESTVASLLMCMESVFAVLAGALILHELLTGREILGCCIMFAAIILSQLSGIISKKGNRHSQTDTDV